MRFPQINLTEVVNTYENITFALQKLYEHAPAGRIFNSDWFVKRFCNRCIREVFLFQSEFDGQRMTKKSSHRQLSSTIYEPANQSELDILPSG